ncbi:MAG: LAGLIDADG family homing endonuclease [bacterium]|nr:LAGLIDADG family homing endonuclease [bacterium]
MNKTEKTKVLFIPIGYQASGMYRMSLPAYYINENGNMEICVEPAGANVTSELVDMFDIVVLQRCASTSMLNLIQYCRKEKKKIVMDVDDLFVEVPDWNPAKNSYRSENLTIHSQIIRMVDMITVTTPKLAEYYQEITKTVKILPNCVDFDLYGENVGNARIENKDNQIRLLWMGSATHQEDFKIIEDVVSKLIEKHNIKFVVYGQLPEKMVTDKFDSKNIEYHGFTPFNFYYQSLHRINATIGIAPLVDIRFNEFKCVSSDTLVATTEGFRKALDLTTSDIVITEDGNKKIQAIEHNKDEVFNIETNCGYSVEATKNHRFLVYNQEKGLIFKDVSNMSESDYMLIQKRKLLFNDKSIPFEFETGNKTAILKRQKTQEAIDIVLKNGLKGQKAVKELNRMGALTLSGKKWDVYNWWSTRKLDTTKASHRIAKQRDLKYPQRLNKELALVLGYLIGDGYLRKDRNNIGLTSINPEIINNYIRIMRQEFNLETMIHKKAGTKAIDLRSYSVDLIRFLTSIGVKLVGSKDKEVPECVLYGDTEIIKSFLGGYFDTDGSVILNRKFNTGVIMVNSVSEKLLKQVQVLLLSLGILSKRRRMLVKIKGEKYTYYLLSIAVESVPQFIKEIKFSVDYKQVRLLELKRRLETRTKGHSNIGLYPVNNLMRKIYSIAKEKGIALPAKFWNYLHKKNRIEFPSFKVLKEFVEFYKSVSYLSEYKVLKRIIDNNLVIDKISYIKRVEELKTVVDIDVNNDLFLANGIVSHNSPLKALEYGMMGVPVVATDIYPYKLVIENGTNGLLVKNKHEDWYEAIESLILDEEKRTRLGKNLNSKIMDKYNVKAEAEKWEKAYLSLINS